MNKPYITLRVFITEIIGYVVMLGAFLVATVKCITCDGEIVSHYNAAGEPDKYSNPGILFMLPGIMIFTMLMCSLILHLMPSEAWNMPGKIKENQQVKSYEQASIMIVLMNLMIAIFSLIVTVFFENESVILIAAVALCVALIPAIVVPIIRIRKINR